MRLEGRPLVDQIARSAPPADPVEWLASFVALQASSALGKEVSIVCDGRWRTAGYAALSPSAVRRGFRERLVPGQLAKRVASIPQQFLATLVAR